MKKEIMRFSDVFTNSTEPMLSFSFCLCAGEWLAVAGYDHSGRKDFYDLLGGGIEATQGKVSRKKDLKVYRLTDIRSYGSNLTVLETISLIPERQNGLMSIVNDRKIRTVVLDFMKDNELTDYEYLLDKPIPELTDYERLVYELLKVCYTKADIFIIADSHLSLSLQQADKLAGIIRMLCSRGTTIICDYEECLPYWLNELDRIMIMRNGFVCRVIAGSDRVRQIEKEVEYYLNTGENDYQLIAQVSEDDVSKIKLVNLENNKMIRLSDSEVTGVILEYQKFSSYRNFYQDAFLRLDCSGKEIPLTDPKVLVENRVALILDDAENQIFTNLSPVDNIMMLYHVRNRKREKPEVEKYLCSQMISTYPFLDGLQNVLDKADSYSLRGELAFQCNAARWLMIRPATVIISVSMQQFQNRQFRALNMTIEKLLSKGCSVLLLNESGKVLERFGVSVFSFL